MFEIVMRNNFDKEKILKDKEISDSENGITLCRSCHAKEHRLVKGAIIDVKNY